MTTAEAVLNLSPASTLTHLLATGLQILTPLQTVLSPLYRLHCLKGTMNLLLEWIWFLDSAKES